MENVNVGDIVKVTRNDGRVFECFVVKDYPERKLFYGRVLESSKDKVSTASWYRYGLVGNGVCQVLEDCKSIDVVRKGTSEILEDVTDTTIYTNINPTTNKKITFCLSEGFGGWSENETPDALFESCINADRSRQIVEEEGEE